MESLTSMRRPNAKAAPWPTARGSCSVQKTSSSSTKSGRTSSHVPDHGSTWKRYAARKETKMTPAPAGPFITSRATGVRSAGRTAASFAPRPRGAFLPRLARFFLERLGPRRRGRERKQQHVAVMVDRRRRVGHDAREHVGGVLLHARDF